MGTTAASIRGVSEPVITGPHDRRATDLLRNAQVVSVVVEDPGELVHLGGGKMGRAEAGGKINVVRSLRHDPLAAMHGQKINPLNEAQYLAGRHWQRNRELTEIGGARAIDFTREAVDGGGPMEARITDEKIRASKQMKVATALLGQEGEALMNSFLDDCLGIKEISLKWGRRTERERLYIGQRVRECLTTLAICFGYETQPIERSYPQLVVGGACKPVSNLIRKTQG
jgi:hypothetical protein